jgi:hypothetical protein
MVDVYALTDTIRNTSTWTYYGDRNFRAAYEGGRLYVIDADFVGSVPRTYTPAPYDIWGHVKKPKAKEFNAWMDDVHRDKRQGQGQ